MWCAGLLHPTNLIDEEEHDQDVVAPADKQNSDGA